MKKSTKFRNWLLNKKKNLISPSDYSHQIIVIDNLLKKKSKKSPTNKLTAVVKRKTLNLMKFTFVFQMSNS